MRLISIVLLTFSTLLSAQKIDELDYVMTQSFTADFEHHVVRGHLMIEEHRVRLNDDLYYTWVKSGELRKTRGDYSGKLLHGECAEYYKSGNLKAKGIYKYGVKDKTWKYWSQDGEYQKVEEWKEGLLDGEVKTYNTLGQLEKVARYQQNQLHGKSEDVLSGAYTYYKRGVEISEEEIKETVALDKSSKKNKKKKEKEEKRKERALYE